MDFKIPSSRDDLLSLSRAGDYVVEEVLTLRQIPAALQGFKSSYKRNPHSIRENFDTIFSILCLQKDLDAAVKEEAWVLLTKACVLFQEKLATFLDGSDLDKEEIADYLATLKMTVYLLCQFLELFDSDAIKPTTLVSGKGRAKKKAKPAAGASVGMDWEHERHEGLDLVMKLVQCDLRPLWAPSFVEEDFINVVSKCCYKLLENPTLASTKDSLVVVGHIIGILVRRYNHGLGASLKMDQLLKHFEFLTTPIAVMVEVMVRDHQCGTIVADIIREIGNTTNVEASKDSTIAKAYAGFLVELAERIPTTLLPCVALLVCHLDGESYTLRNGVLSMMGTILIKHLSKEQLDDNLKNTRDVYFEKLEDHIHDVNAFVRSKVLQIWLNIVTEQCLPLLQQESLMELVVGRLHDKSSIVRRHALQLLTTLLKSNPFAAKLGVDDLKSNYDKEKATLEEMSPTVVEALPEGGDPVDEKWAGLEDDLVEAMTGLDLGEDRRADVIGEEDRADDVLNKVVHHLEGREWNEAATLVTAAKESFPDNPAFSGSQADEEEAESNSDKQDELVALMKQVFCWMKKPSPQQPVQEDEEGNTAEIAKQQTLVQYLKNSLTFAIQVQKAIPVICQLLGSKNGSDVLEAIQFFVIAVQFGVGAAQVGVRRMLVLVWSQEATVREALVEAYRQLYLEPREEGSRNCAIAIVKSMSSLLVEPSVGDLASLEKLMSEFVSRGHLGPPVLQVLWERLALRSGATTAQDSRAAVQLIAMCAQAEPEIVKTNLEVLVKEGLGERAEGDYLLAQGVCQALLTLAAKKVKGKPSPTYRLEADHEMFTRLTTILIKGLPDSTNPLWLPMASQAVMLIYKLAETPDAVCAGLMRSLALTLTSLLTPGEEQGAGEGPAISAQASCVLSRVLAVAGEVAFRQTVFLEVDVLGELKKRQAEMEETRRSKGGKKGDKDRRKSSQTGRSEAEMEEEAALAGASAEDGEAEFIRRLTEMELLDESNMLSAFPPVLVSVCTHTDKFPDLDLQASAALALARFMVVSSALCDSHLQLLFTLLERSHSPVTRCNLIIALGDLTFRYPNLVEPWTAHLYARLSDPSPTVRKTTLQVLTHLILNDMVKVKGQISQLATCIVDTDERISGLAKLFFHELAKKGNSMYNMPDIISRLSDPELGVDEDKFHIIIKYIFSHIEKSRHCESLAEKLCHRFRALPNERQSRDLAFCLSQLSYTDKGIGKLMENFACFADRLVDDAVYAHFTHILSKSRQFVKPEAKAVLDEFEDKLLAAHNKGLDEEATDTRATQAKSVCAKAGRKTPGRKKVSRSNKENDKIPEEEEVSFKRSSRATKSSKVDKVKGAKKFVMDSDDDDDMFTGKEGTDDLPMTPAKRKSKRGKVALSPMT